jgi:F-type H+-transporting ATPase subunit delta
MAKIGVIGAGSWGTALSRLLATTGYVDFEIDYIVDESLIGGMVIRIGDRVVDSSIKTKLDEFAKDLKKIQLA